MENTKSQKSMSDDDMLIDSVAQEAIRAVHAHDVPRFHSAMSAYCAHVMSKMNDEGEEDADEQEA